MKGTAQGGVAGELRSWGSRGQEGGSQEAGMATSRVPEGTRLLWQGGEAPPVRGRPGGDPQRCRAGVWGPTRVRLTPALPWNSISLRGPPGIRQDCGCHAQVRSGTHAPPSAVPGLPRSPRRVLESGRGWGFTASLFPFEHIIFQTEHPLIVPNRPTQTHRHSRINKPAFNFRVRHTRAGKSRRNLI